MWNCLCHSYAKLISLELAVYSWLADFDRNKILSGFSALANARIDEFNDRLPSFWTSFASQFFHKIRLDELTRVLR